MSAKEEMDPACKRQDRPGEGERAAAAGLSQCFAWRR